jgi:glycosyltransferase involved in cell wall biosynthesis/GT2 family glycosyltransferase
VGTEFCTRIDDIDVKGDVAPGLLHAHGFLEKVCLYTDDFRLEPANGTEDRRDSIKREAMTTVWRRLRRSLRTLFARPAATRPIAEPAPTVPTPPPPYRTVHGASETARRWYAPDAPQVSIVVVNHDNSDRTSRCVDQIWRHTAGYRYELLLIDNASAGDSFAALLDIDGPCRLLRLGKVRSLGEANNIGFERSTAPFVVFLSADTRVTEGWLAPLISRLEQAASAGAAGPRFVAPDGALVESAGRVGERGEVTPLGAPRQDRAPVPADYVSMACLAVKRSVFEQIGGFDLLFEETEYADIDACLKIQRLGKTVYYCPAASVIRLEPEANGTPVDVDVDADTIVARQERRRRDHAALAAAHRENFIGSWGEWLATGRERVAAPAPPKRHTNGRSNGRPSVVFATPHDLAIGGGERYVLSAAAALAKSYDVYVVTDESYSGFRLRGLERELGLDLSGVRLLSQAQMPGIERLEHCFVLGNEVVPPLPGLAKHNWYICQFPTPMPADDLAARWSNFSGFDTAIVYSDFVRGHLERALATAKLDPIRIEVVYPPVALAEDAAPKSLEAPLQIVSIGRFFSRHSKRHDVAVRALAKLRERGIEAELHLVGSVPHRLLNSQRLGKLREKASGLPVTLHINAPRGVVDRLIRDAALCWHAAGFEVDPELEPESCEHFGIGIVEAMSAGCVPLVCDNGGPKEFIVEGQHGFFYNTIDELAGKSERVLRDRAMFAKVSEEARKQAAQFSDAAFAARWRSLVD